MFRLIAKFFEFIFGSFDKILDFVFALVLKVAVDIIILPILCTLCFVCSKICDMFEYIFKFIFSISFVSKFVKFLEKTIEIILIIFVGIIKLITSDGNKKEYNEPCGQGTYDCGGDGGGE